MKLSYPLGTADSGPMEGKWFPFGVGIDCHKDMVWAFLGEKETTCPSRGELAMIPCVLSTNGQLREARDLGQEF